jgi:glutathione S-transferase
MAGGLHADIDIPYDAEFELYHNGLSLCSKKVRFCLAELGIEYVSHHIDLIETGAYENLSRAFLAINPAAVVPVLIHRGHPVYESHDIIRYAADHSDTPGELVPADPARRAAMQTWVDRASLVGDDPIANASESAGNAVPGLTVPLFAAMIEEVPYWRIAEGVLFHRLKRRALLFLAMKAGGLSRLPRSPARSIMAECASQIARHLDALDAQLEESGGPWILGERFSLADVSWLPIFERLREADSLHCFIGGGRRAATGAYWERLRERPSYRAAILAHSLPSIASGTQRLIAAKAADPALRAALEPQTDETTSHARGKRT